MAKTRLGLPASVDTKNPEALQQAMDRILETLRVMTGERGPSGQQVATQDDLAALEQKLS